MDFVDLDKVLDQFEEEEKAADQLVPGQETKPSGYVQYLDRQREITWTSLSYTLPPDATPFKEYLSSFQPSSGYDNSYDGFRGNTSIKPAVEFQGPVGEKVRSTLGSYLTSSTDHSDHYHSHNGIPGVLPVHNTEQSVSLQEDALQIKLKQDTIESYMSLQLNGTTFEQTKGGNLDGAIKPRSGEESEKRGLIASLPVGVQTDSLSPASEQELLFSTLPRTDILVTGHGDTAKSANDSCAVNESETINISSSECFSYKQDSEMSTINGSAARHDSSRLDVGSQENSGVCTVDGRLGVGQHVITETVVMADGCAINRSPGADQQVETPVTVDKERTCFSHVGIQERHKWDESEAGSIPCRQFQDVRTRLLSDDPGGVLEKEAEENLQSKGLQLTDTVAFPPTDNLTVIGFREEMANMDSDAIEAYLNDLESSPDIDWSNTLSDCNIDVSESGHAHSTDQPDPNQFRLYNAEPSHAVVNESSPSGSNAQRVESYNLQDSYLHGCPDDVAVALTSCGVIKVQEDQKLCSPDTNNSSFGGSDTEAECNHSSTMQPLDVAMDQSMQVEGNVKIAAQDNELTVPRDTIASLHTQDGELTAPRDTTASLHTFSFPNTDCSINMSTLVRGKLEIEGLLDEMLAARLKQGNCSVVRNNGEAVQTGSGDEVTEQKAGRGEDNQPHLGLPSLDSHSAELQQSSGAEKQAADCPHPNQNGTMLQTMGIGARPKDPSQMKKNRPNSLLGLSKISLGVPFAGSQSPQVGPQQIVNGVAMIHPCDQALPPVQGDQTQQISPSFMHCGVHETPDTSYLPSSDIGQEINSIVHPASASELSVGVSELDAPVMRRQEAAMLGEGIDVSSSSLRPRSWSPTTLAVQPAQKMKRPTSLNLPVRQDLSVAGGLSPESGNLNAKKPGAFSEKGSDTCSSEDSIAVGDTGDVDGGRRRQEETETFATAVTDVHMDSGRQPILHLNLGRVAPTWVPDAEAPTCMECDARFTFTKRRHHCRACGKVFCSTCCNLKSRLAYLDNKEGRVCIPCHQMLAAAESCRPAGGPCGSPNPNNPTEYCSTIPPTQQASAGAPLPTVMVPTGVLKREGSNRKSEPKQVMFSDGIRPGGDLTELDGSDQAHIPPRRSGRVQKKVERPQGGQSSPKTRRMRGSEGARNPCLIPEEGLPPVATHSETNGDITLTENPDVVALMAQIRDEEASPVIFAVNQNLLVLVKIINLDCCVHRVVWCFTTQGMANVGQDELVVVLETLPDENTVPRDIFCHFSTIYEEAGKGNKVGHMGHTIFTQQFLDNRSHGGFLYLRASFQCTHKLLLPSPPFLFAVLLQKWETPWAKVFPIRLMLRLGAEYRYYPCPLVSIRNRKPVFYEIGHTIMNLLADFRNFQYMLPQISGVTIHMEDKKTLINFPRNRYQEVMKIVASSNEHVMALGASFSLEADSHLVCIQNEDCNYQTQAINIQNKPRKVTGASFVVFNGALKASTGLRAKSSIVEDGLMVQILPETMASLKQSMKDMVDFSVACGSVSVPQPEEMVIVRWVEDDKNVNIGVRSAVDGMSLDGVESIRVHNAADYVTDYYAIRWTEVFFLQTESGSSRWEPVDLSHVAQTLASAACVALTPHLEQLKQASLVKIGLRVTLESERVGYEVGSNGQRLSDFYMNDLDNALIPVIHGAVSTSRDGPIVLELILHVIN